MPKFEKAYNPNRRPFGRGEVIEKLADKKHLHPLRREEMVSYFQGRNPEGFWHDLGAQDVFLDNFGMLCQEQFIPWPGGGGYELWEAYERACRVLLARWEMLCKRVLQMKPYWGAHFNSSKRTANAGEPRSLIRLLHGSDWSRVSNIDLPSSDGPSRYPGTGPHAEDFDLYDLFSTVAFPGLLPSSTDASPGYWDWPGESLINRTLPMGEAVRSPYPAGLYIGGVPLPDTHPRQVGRLAILDPRHSTPDLPQRVGLPSRGRPLDGLVRNQGSLGTCTSHAFATALDVLARRQHGRKEKFSPAWLHCKSGMVGGEGRSLDEVARVLQSALPCEERFFPYRENVDRRASPDTASR